MIAEREKKFDFQSTVTGDKVAMSIDENAMAHIMSILTDLYSDPVMAVIREYSTNALDAHVEAKNSAPIEVTTPTALAPFLRIKDYGVGLSADDIRNMYSRYGASSKRETNEQVGMLGLGSKSALTYTNQFTLVGVKNGVKTTVSVSRDEDGRGSMTILEEVQTDEPSGVEVIIPSKNVNDMRSKATEFFRFWKPGTVLVNGEEPKHIDGMWIDENIVLTTEVNASMIVMGNVAYPVEEPYRWGTFGNYYNGFRTVAYVNIGEVNFTPSREALQMTKKTKDAIERLTKEVQDKKDAAINKQIAEAKTHHEALALMLDFEDLISKRANVTYKGVEFPTTMTVPDGQQQFVIVSSPRRYRQKLYGANRSITPSWWRESKWLVGYDSEKFTPTKEAKLAQWREKNNIDEGQFILIDTIPDTTWIDPASIYQWADVAAEKLPPRKANGVTSDGRVTGSYDVIEDGQGKSNVLASDIDTSKPVYYVNTTTHGYQVYEYRNALEGQSYTLVKLANNRIEKFRRDFPNARDIVAVVREQYDDWKKQLNDSELVALRLALTNRGEAELSALQPDKIIDPTLKATVEVARNNKLIQKVWDKFSIFRVLPDDLTRDLPKWENPIQDYPLIAVIRSHNIPRQGKAADDLYLYLNTAYAKRQAEAIMAGTQLMATKSN